MDSMIDRDDERREASVSRLTIHDPRTDGLDEGGYYFKFKALAPRDIDPMPDMIMSAGDGTHRVIESDAIRALVGYVAQRDGGYRT